MHKIVVAVTGASGSIYARQLLNKLIALKDQWQALSVIMTDNAKEVWKTELEDDAYRHYELPFFFPAGFFGALCLGFGEIQYHDHYPLLDGHAGKGSLPASLPI